MTRDKDEQAKVWNLAEKIGFCMLATQVGCSIRSRPMSAHPQASENAFNFLTDVASHKDDEIETNRSVCLALAESKGQKYVSISGAVEVLNDRSKIRDLWATPAKAWWDSADDPSIRVLKVTPDFAEYWDSPGTIVSYIKMAAAAVSHVRTDMGDNAKVTMGTIQGGSDYEQFRKYY
ncbi:general stress protein [Ensifer adhaerens]|uniref:pyridoxamine 5'-phosphate oxidase family protein n=1 Tax=Ensifer canadensis TaxID=555315 RepID=UPI00148F8660|nr:pyridoxamine 5'-phosphate oxidase family protein [Ensifer canadensis]NOV21773.1 general stress protein [Ensifer canadensis]